MTCENIVDLNGVCGYSVPPSVCSRSRNLLLSNGVPDADKSSDTEQGLCDMVGSVEEFMMDAYAGSVNSLPTDGSPLVIRSFYRVTRGGAWTSSSSHLNTTKRLRHFFSKSASHIGFRVIRRDAP